jgi:NADH dehydrogenase/NADH:ubiquinone oxidoreductase subunit G
MNLKMDGRTAAFEGRPTLLEVARANGIYIPSLCDHPELEPYAACRLCLVEVKGRRGFVPACSTAAAEGLEVLTATPEIQALRRGILELILAEHPNACLICAEKSSCDDMKSTIRKTGEVTGCVLCPANGRCELQRVVEAIGVERVHFPSLRREGEVRRDDPFIDRDNSLCILCGRCVRVCHEIRGASVLTFVSRGSQTVVGTALNKRLLDSACRFCGACVDVCPTGSLADRAVRYERLPDEEKRTVCTLCGQGCGLRLELREGRILNVLPDPEGAVNHGQACVRGRFLVRDAVYHKRRLLRPMVRRDGRLQEATWEEALTVAAERLAGFGPGEVAVAGSSENSCEDLFVLHKFAAEVLKSPSVAGPWTGSAAARLGGICAANFRISDIWEAEAIAIFDIDLPLTQPIVGLAVHRAFRIGAAIVSVGPDETPAGRSSSIKVGLPEGKTAGFLKALTAVLRGSSSAATVKAGGVGKKRLLEIAAFLKERSPSYFLVGPEFLRSPARSSIPAALRDLASLTGSRIIPLDGTANVRGGDKIARAFPGGPLTPEDLLAAVDRGDIKALYLAGSFPKVAPGAAKFVIIQGSYTDENADIADILLPETTSFEAEGTFVNVEGRIQIAGCAVEPLGEARPGWLVLSGLASKMGSAGFGYASAEEIRQDLAGAAAAFKDLVTPPGPREGLFLIEEPAGPEAITGKKEARVRAAITRPSERRAVDVYKGLNLALESKSLRLVRGR